MNKNKKDLIVILVAAGILALGVLLSVMCQPAKAENMCTYTFNQEQTNTITISLDELQECRGMATSLNAIVEKQDEKISDLTLANEKYKEAMEAQKTTITTLQKISEEKESIRALEKTQCDKKIEEAKPKLKDKATWFSGGVLTTILTAVIAILAL